MKNWDISIYLDFLPFLFFYLPFNTTFHFPLQDPVKRNEYFNILLALFCFLNIKIPGFLRDVQTANKKGYSLAMAVTQEKMHLQNIHRKKKLEATRPLNQWAAGKKPTKLTMGF